MVYDDAHLTHVICVNCVAVRGEGKGVLVPAVISLKTSTLVDVTKLNRWRRQYGIIGEIFWQPVDLLLVNIGLFNAQLHVHLKK